MKIIVHLMQCAQLPQHQKLTITKLKSKDTMICLIDVVWCLWKKTLEINADINNVIIVYIKWSFCVVKTIKLKKYVDIVSLYSDQWAQPANMISLRCSHTPTQYTLYMRGWTKTDRYSLAQIQTNTQKKQTDTQPHTHTHSIWEAGQTLTCTNTDTHSIG